MAILNFSLAKDGDKQLSANFKVREFACKDGSDIILIDEGLVTLLQTVRDHFGRSVSISSAYRTASHNAKIGGSPNSQHLFGKAADIVVSGVLPLTVCRYAESRSVGGIGHYPAGQGNFTHVDTRAGLSRWERRNGVDVAVKGFVEEPQPGKTAAQIVQEKAGLDDNTMLYLQFYRYGQDLLEKLARAMS